MHTGDPEADALRARVNAKRAHINTETAKYYSGAGSGSGSGSGSSWVCGFLRQNKLDWEEACAALDPAGNRYAVAYLWDDLLAQAQQQEQEQEQKQAENCRTHNDSSGGSTAGGQNLASSRL